MKNIEASVNAVFTQVKKEAEKKEEDYHMVRNKMVFYLREHPNYQIHGVAEWCENTRGDTVKGLDTYFLHILTGQRCETPWTCMVGLNYEEYHEEIWETPCMRIINYKNIKEDMCHEKEVCV